MIGPEDEPRHVARFGTKFDAQGVLAGSRDAGRCIGYLTKYLHVVSEVLGHASISITKDMYGKARELHLTGDVCPVPRLCGQPE